ncbi:MAG: membrane associated rhomboid family serine protease [Flavobacteriales bacterium]|jgi:membrane associated rhomboid family serine protease
MRKRFSQDFKLIVYPMVLMLIIHCVNVLFDGVLYQFSLIPHKISTLPYIFTSPFLHGSWEHLLGNLSGFAVLSFLCLFRGRSFYLLSSFFIIFSTGLLVWVFARPSAHIGASGWIFGLWSLSIAMAWFERKPLNILIAIIVLALYGGMFFGVFPGREGISFESHLYGALSGVLCALFLSKRRLSKSIRNSRRR